MRKPPGLLIVVDPGQEKLAIAEARKLGIPILALVDTNCDPDPIDHVIPCNDDAQRSVKLILQALADAIVSKKGEMHLIEGKEDGGRKSDEAEEMAKAFDKVEAVERKD